MRRDPRLSGLSSDHHGSLVLSRRIVRVCDDGPVEDDFVAAVCRVFEQELEPHFRVEEDHLLPGLEAADLAQVARRIREEHQHMRELVAALGEEGPDQDALLREFADALREHVRHEEREVLPLAEARLDARHLEAIGRVHPHPGRFVTGETP